MLLLVRGDVCVLSESSCPVAAQVRGTKAVEAIIPSLSNIDNVIVIELVNIKQQSFIYCRSTASETVKTLMAYGYTIDPPINEGPESKSTCLSFPGLA